mgnify:CR=1 FL=1
MPPQSVASGFWVDQASGYGAKPHNLDDPRGTSSRNCWCPENNQEVTMQPGSGSGSGVPGRRPSDPPPVRRRPSVAPSARSRGGGVEGCDHADGTPAACFAAWRVGSRAPSDAMGAVPGTFSRRKESQAPGPRFFDASRARKGIVGTMSNPARPGESHMPTCSDTPVSYTHLRAHETNDLISDAVFCG